jgi:hypothetical protein
MHLTTQGNVLVAAQLAEMLKPLVAAVRNSRP